MQEPGKAGIPSRNEAHKLCSWYFSKTFRAVHLPSIITRTHKERLLLHSPNASSRLGYSQQPTNDRKMAVFHTYYMASTTLNA